jgi:hypothetical protein
MGRLEAMRRTGGGLWWEVLHLTICRLTIATNKAHALSLPARGTSELQVHSRADDDPVIWP